MLLEVVLSAYLLAVEGGAEQRALEALEANDLGGALAAAREVSDPFTRATLECRAYHVARDFPRLLRSAETGLEHRPQDLVLLWRAASAELWLQDGVRASLFVERLAEALSASSLVEPERSAWETNVSSFTEQADALRASARSTERSVTRARVVSLAIVAGGLLVLVIGGRRTPE